MGHINGDKESHSRKPLCGDTEPMQNGADLAVAGNVANATPIPQETEEPIYHYEDLEISNEIEEASFDACQFTSSDVCQKNNLNQINPSSSSSGSSSLENYQCLQIEETTDSGGRCHLDENKADDASHDSTYSSEADDIPGQGQPEEVKVDDTDRSDCKDSGTGQLLSICREKPMNDLSDAAQPAHGNDGESYSSTSSEKELADQIQSELCDLLSILDLNNKSSEKDSVSLDDFSNVKMLGKGAFGDVFLVRKKQGPDANAYYALKAISKHHLEGHKYSEMHFWSERHALSIVRGGPFMSKLYYAFQSPSHLFMAMDHNSGGQLLAQFMDDKVLLEPNMRFYMAELVLAVEHIHKCGVIHRDIKPENVLLDSEGHVVLIDFGLCKVVINGKENNSHVGTEPYIAPEILLDKPHDRMVDFWSLGVLGYEMIVGQTPFNIELTDEELEKEVLQKDPFFSPKLFHKPAISFLGQLMKRDPKQRLGCFFKNGKGGMDSIKKHMFFKCMDWEKVRNRKLKPPSCPPRENLSKCKEKPFNKLKDNGFRKAFSHFSYSWLKKEDGSS